jgi:DNA-binding transcriptional LysR family regulator
LFVDRPKTVASPKYLAARGTPQTPQDLLNHDCISYIDPKTRLRSPWRFSRDGKSVTINVPESLAVDESELMIDAALSHLGIARVMPYRLRNYPGSSRLKVILEPWQSEAMAVMLLVHRREQQPQRVSAFMDFMVSKYSTKKTHTDERRAVEPPTARSDGRR